MTSLSGTMGPWWAMTSKTHLPTISVLVPALTFAAQTKVAILGFQTTRKAAIYLGATVMATWRWLIALWHLSSHSKIPKHTLPNSRLPREFLHPATSGAHHHDEALPCPRPPGATAHEQQQQETILRAPLLRERRFAPFCSLGAPASVPACSFFAPPREIPRFPIATSCTDRFLACSSATEIPGVLR